MNAFQYMKNASKGVAYASKEVWKKYNPTAAALASSAAQMGSELNQSIKNLKESAKGDDTYFKAGKEAGKEYVSNLLSDLKTGNWYNTQRQEEASNEMLKNMGFGDMMDFNMDFDMDDFGDDLDKSGVSETVKKQISSEQQSTKAMVTGMDVVGGKVSGALSTASAKSAQYIASVQMQTSKALYDLTSKGFAGVSVGIASINTNVTSLVEFTKPLSAHLQSVEEYNATSLNNQQKALELLKKISDNTTPVSATNDRKHKRNINDLITGGVLDIGEYKEMLKEQFSIVTSLGSMFLGKDSLFSGLGITKKGMINTALGTESPMLNILTKLISALVPKKVRKSSGNLDKVLANLFPMLFSKVNKSNSMFAGLLKYFFMPSNDIKEKLSPGTFKRGKVDWDGEARQALTYVIPRQLSAIVAAVTHDDAQIYNYNTGKFQTTREIKSGLKNIKDTYADSAGRDYIRAAENTINHMKISDAQKKNLKDALKQYNRNRFHNAANPMSGLSQDFVTYWELYQKAQSAGNTAQYEGDMWRAQADYNNRIESMEQSGNSVYTSLYDGFKQIDEKERASTLLGVDKDKHDIFFYLHGIYENTKNASRGKGTNTEETSYNTSNIVGGKGGKNRRRKYNKSKSSTSSKTSTSSSASEGPISIDANSVKESLEQAELDDDYDATHTGNEEIDNYIRDSRAGIIPKDPVMEKRIEARGTVKGFVHEKFGPDSTFAKGIKSTNVKKVYDKLIKSVEGMASQPINAMSGLLDAASNSIINVLLGTGKDGLKEWFKGKFVKAIDTVKAKFLSSDLYKSMQQTFKEIKANILGKFLGLFAPPSGGNEKEDTAEGEVPTEGATAKYNGSRYVSKTGIVAVSKGEMIIPAELNPYYDGPIDKAKQRESELASIDDFYGSFSNGGKFVGSKHSRRNRRGKKVKTDKNGKILSDAKGLGKVVEAGKAFGSKVGEDAKAGAKTAGGAIYQGASTLVKGIGSFIGSLMPGDKKAVDAEKKSVSNVVEAALKDAGAAKGAAAVGALVGGGVSLLTGGLVGPILGASIGAATGFIVKSDAVQDALFGKIDEKTGKRGGKETGGLLSKNMADFMSKKVPSMGKGAAIGAAGGLFMGSPVMGALLGSAAGYIKSSDTAQDFLFGSKDKDGNRLDNDIIRKKLQDEIKHRVPGISAGALAGMLAGPFGFAQNIIVGSAIGYVASGEKFKTWLFGSDKDGEHKEGFAGLLKKNLIEPIVDIFANVGNKISQDISNHMKNLERKIRDRIAKTLGKGFSRLGGFMWNGLRKVIPALPETPVKIFGNVLNGVRNHVVNKNLKKGYNVFDSKLGRNLTASERIERRNKTGKRSLTDSLYQSTDELISQANSPEELDKMSALMDTMSDPTKAYTKDLTTARENVRNILKGNFEENLSDADKANGKKGIDRKAANQFQAMLRKGDYDGAKKLAGTFGLDQDTLGKLSTEIDNQSTAQAGIKDVTENANAAKQKILDAAGYKGKLKAEDLNSDTINKIKTSLETEKGAERFSPEKMQEKAVTDTIPNLIKQVIGILVKDPKTMEAVSKDLGDPNIKKEAEEEAKKESEKAGPSPTAAAAEENIASGFDVTHDESGAAVPENIVEDGENKEYNAKEGKYEADLSDTDTKKKVEDEAAITSSIKSIPVISSAFTGISGILGTFKTKLFGTGEGEKKKGLFGSLLGILTGEDSKSPLKSIFSWIVGKTGLSSIFTKIFGGITLKGVLSDALVVGLLAAATNGVFDNIFANFPGYGKKKNSTTYNAKTGSGIATNDDGSIKTDANGNPIDNKGKVVDIKDVNYKITDQMSLSQRFKYNLGRGLFTGTGSVLQVGLKYGTKLGSKFLPKNFGTMSIYDAIQKVMDAIKGIKTPGVAENLKNVDLDAMGKQIGDQAVKNSGGAAKTVSSTMFIVAIVLAVYDFMDGYEDASTTLKIQNPTIGESIACGITRALKNAVPVVGTFVPDEQIIGIAMMYFEEQGLVNKKKLQQQQASAEQVRTKYNAEHGTNYDWAQLNKTVFENYTWLERTKNLLGSDWTRMKLNSGKAMTTVKNKGLGGFFSSKFSDFKNTYKAAFKSTNDVGSALAEGTKEATGSESLGLINQLTAYALNGKFKQFLTLEPAEFKKNLANKDAVDPGIFSKLMGQMYLYGFKFMLMPVAGATGTVRGIADWYQSKVVDPLKTDRANFEKSKEDVLKQTTVGGIWKVKGEFTGALGPVFNTSLFMQKLFSTPVVLLKEVMNTFPNVLKDVGSWIKDKFDWITGKKKSDDTTNTDTTANDTSAGGSFISQNNPAYAKKKIGRSNVGALGCGPAAAYMALNMSAGRSNTMNNAINVANKYQTGTGTDAAYFGDYFGRNGASASYYDAGSAGGQTGIINNLRSNRPTILMGQDSNNTSKAYSPFGPNNHYVVASGFDRSGNVIVNDPEANRGGIKYNPSILRNVKMGIGVSGGGSRLRRFGISGGGQQVYSHSLRNDPTTQAVWKFLKTRGYTDYAAAGVMGNMQQESGIDPTVVNSIGAHGICQWLNGRWTKLQAYAKSKGTDWTDLKTQLEFADQEISSIGGLGDNYKNSTANASECAKQFEAKFEISGGSALAKREQYAEYYYKQFVDNSGALGYTPGGNLLGSTGIVNYSNTADRATLARTNSKATLGSTVTDTSNAVTKGKISGSDSNGSKGKGNVMGILSGIMNVFGKIGDIFTGSSSSDTTNEDTTPTDTTGTDTGSITGSIGDSVDELTSKLPNSTGASPIGRKAVAYMDSIKGTIPYSMTGARNPEKGSEDCSSSVQWAIKKAGGPDIGGYTGAQSSSKYLNTVWKGRNPSSLPSNIKPGDVMFFTRKYSTNNPTYPDDIGHVGMYMGDGKLIDHGSGMGPKIKDMTSASFINDSSYGMPTLRQVSRLYDATSNSSADTTSYSNSADRASLAKTAVIGPAKKGQISGSGSGLIGLQGDGGDSGLTPTAINNTKGKSSSIMSKDTAALLKVIITLIESLVDNTKRNNDIYDIIKQYCGNAGAKGAAASAAVDALKSKSSSTDSVEKSLASLKTSIDSILAS